MNLVERAPQKYGSPGQSGIKVIKNPKIFRIV